MNNVFAEVIMSFTRTTYKVQILIEPDYNTALQ